METTEKSAIEKLYEVIGKFRPLEDKVDHSLFDVNPLLRKLISIGPCFYTVSDLHAMKFTKVSDNSTAVSGFSPEEILQMGPEFSFRYTHPDDQADSYEMLKIAWQFLQDLSPSDKPNYVTNFYYRALKKDGTVIKVQHQVVNAKVDESGNILLAFSLITDITHLNLPDEVKVTLVNPTKNKFFAFSAENSKPIEKAPLLSKREIEVLKLVANGLSSKQIADKLSISYYTAKTHRKNILEKLGKKNTAETVSYMLSNGFLSEPEMRNQSK